MGGSLPRGWFPFNNTVEPGPRVSDYAARGQLVTGGCRATGCNRRVVLDPELLVKAGLGALDMNRVKPLWRCNRVEGCELGFSNERPSVPLRLGHFLDFPHVRILVKCRGKDCKFARVYLVEAIIKGLVDRKQGSEDTEIEALASKMTSPCPLCKKKNWDASVLWADTDTAGWRAQGSSYFERYGTG